MSYSTMPISDDEAARYAEEEAARLAARTPEQIQYDEQAQLWASDLNVFLDNLLQYGITQQRLQGLYTEIGLGTAEDFYAQANPNDYSWIFAPENREKAFIAYLDSPITSDAQLRNFEQGQAWGKYLGPEDAYANPHGNFFERWGQSYSNAADSFIGGTGIQFNYRYDWRFGGGSDPNAPLPYYEDGTGGTGSTDGTGGDSTGTGGTGGNLTGDITDPTAIPSIFDSQISTPLPGDYSSTPLPGNYSTTTPLPTPLPPPPDNIFEGPVLPPPEPYLSQPSSPYPSPDPFAPVPNSAPTVTPPEEIPLNIFEPSPEPPLPAPMGFQLDLGRPGDPSNPNYPGDQYGPGTGVPSPNTEPTSLVASTPLARSIAAYWEQGAGASASRESGGENESGAMRAAGAQAKFSSAGMYRAAKSTTSKAPVSVMGAPKKTVGGGATYRGLPSVGRAPSAGGNAFTGFDVGALTEGFGSAIGFARKIGTGDIARG